MFAILKDRVVHYLLAKDGFITVTYKAAIGGTQLVSIGIHSIRRYHLCSNKINNKLKYHTVRKVPKSI